MFGQATPMKTKSRTNATTDRILILSNRHLTKETLSAIRVTFDFGIRIFSANHRYVIQLRDSEFDSGFWPADLQQITDYALRQGCGWIALDEFAALNSDLPSYGSPS